MGRKKIKIESITDERIRNVRARVSGLPLLAIAGLLTFVVHCR